MATTLAVLQAIAAVVGLLSTLFKLKQSSDDRQAGADAVTAKVNEETANAERRASEAATNAPRGSDLDDKLKSGGVQF